MIPIPPVLLPFISRIGIKGGVIIALVLALAVQSHRINSVKADLAACEADKAQLVQASQDAHERAVQARMAAQERYAELAKDADHELETARTSAMADARAFIARSRLHQNGLRSGGTVAPASDPDTGSGLQADPAAFVDGFVAVPESDVLICTESTLRLEAVQAWASGLNAPQ